VPVYIGMKYWNIQTLVDNSNASQTGLLQPRSASSYSFLGVCVHIGKKGVSEPVSLKKF
jgi:hypothetical protein